MKDEQKLAFEYGRSSDCECVPRYDSRLYGLFVEPHTTENRQRNQNNIEAWYMGSLSKTAEAGNGITPEMLSSALPLFISCNSDTVHRWITFANENVEYEQFVDFETETDKNVAVNRWLETLLAGLLNIRHKYGPDVAKQVCGLALHHSCLYPFEMQGAAEHFNSGGTDDEIEGLIESGVIEDGFTTFLKLDQDAERYLEHPALEDVGGINM